MPLTFVDALYLSLILIADASKCSAKFVVTVGPYIYNGNSEAVSPFFNDLAKGVMVYKICFPDIYLQCHFSILRIYSFQ